MRAGLILSLCIPFGCTRPNPHIEDDTGSGSTSQTDPAGTTTTTSGDGTADTGGTTTSSTTEAPSCTNAKQDGSETDQDCGGEDCDPCPDDAGCEQDSDCISLVCNGTCQAPACDDGVQNADEADIDCGGPCAMCELIPFRDRWVEGTFDETQPDAAIGNDGTMIVVWTADDGTGFRQVMGRWLEPDGDLASTAFSPHGSAMADRRDPSVTLTVGPMQPGTPTSAYVAYADDTTVRFTRVDSVGSPMGTPEVEIPAGPGTYDRPRVAHHAGTLMFAYQRNDDESFVRRFIATLDTPEDPSDVMVGPGAGLPELAPHHSGNFGVVWQTCETLDECDPWFRAHHENSGWVGNAAMAAMVTAGGQYQPQVVALSDEFAVLWLGADNQGGGTSVRTFAAETGEPTSDQQNIDDGLVVAAVALRDNSFAIVTTDGIAGDASIRRFRGDATAWGPIEQPWLMPANSAGFRLAATTDRLLVLWSAEVEPGSPKIVGALFAY